DLETSLGPRDLEMIRRLVRAGPVDGARAFEGMVSGIPAAGGAVAPDQLDPRGVVGPLLDVHLPRVVAEDAEVAECAAVAHGEPFDVEPVRRAFFLAKSDDV